ncbi:MAG: hypothetical protein ACOX6T_04955 [Myxococcales bacterium]
MLRTMLIDAPTSHARRFSAPLAAALFGWAPAGAFACGLCTDAAARRAAWWASLPIALFVALGAEALLFTLDRAVRRRAPRYARGRAHLVGLCGSAAALLLSGGSGLVTAIPFALALGYSFARSLIAERELGRAALCARLGIVLALLSLALARSHPAVMPTGRLVGLSLVAPADWGLEASNWVERELQGRAGASAEIERRLGELRSTRGELPTRAEMALLRLHLLAGGPPQARARYCQGWDLERYERHYGDALAAARIARAVCSPAPD